MAKPAYVIGIDYGTDSVRSVIADASDGKEIAASIFYYPRWTKKMYCDAAANRFRQHPLDYVEGLEHTVKDCISKAGAGIAANIRGISIDTTGSTPVAIDRSGQPLALRPAFADNPNAMFVLWKDHTAVKEAAEINEHAKKFDIDYLQFAGGIYSSEWFWSKLLHILREDAQVRQHIYSFVEHCDWIPFLLTGGSSAAQIKRGVCAAGHKALWSAAYGGYPPDSFFASLDPLLKGISTTLSSETFTSDQPAGHLSKEWADRLGLPAGVVVGIGALDAHMGAVGGQIEPYFLSKVMGTSTCDMLVTPAEDVGNKTVKGICGQVPGSVIPGMMGLEAGQSAFGDFYAWFRNVLMWPLENLLHNTTVLTSQQDVSTIINEISGQIIPELSRQAAALPPEEDAELAIDWINGRRTPDANQLLTGAITGLNLGSDAVQLFRAIAESSCFGAKAITDRFISEGLPLKGLIGLGGIALKSPFIMQMLADVMNMPIKIHRSEQTCAMGAAMFAATAAGIYPTVQEAMNAMGQGFATTYYPDEKRTAIYQKRFERYMTVGRFLEHHALGGANSVTSNEELIAQA